MNVFVKIILTIILLFLGIMGGGIWPYIPVFGIIISIGLFISSIYAIVQIWKKRPVESIVQKLKEESSTNQFDDVNLMNTESQRKQKIPQLLLVTGIISLLGTGSTILSSLMSIILGKPSQEEITESKLELARSLEQVEKNDVQFLEELIRNLQIMLDAMYQNFFLYTFVAALVAGAGLAGIIFMFKRKELGFHLYIIYSLLYVAQSYLFVSPANVPLVLVLTNLGVSGIFIYIYSRSLNWFRNVEL
ncbi:MAG: hypothetical protein ACOVQG_04475 [Crocinitomicaceae bacterium]|jgi:hypothetical protein